MQLSERVARAGVFLRVKDRWLFMVGPDPTGEALGIVRIGGHREPGETPWECAAREAREEASVGIRPSQPPATYWARPEAEMVAREWQENGPPPLVVIPHGPGPEAPLTLLYLAGSDDRPVPAAETKGLLLLTPAEVAALVHGPRATMAQHLKAGGEAILTPGFPVGLPLRPFYHLELLARLLEMHTGLSQSSA